MRCVDHPAGRLIAVEIDQDSLGAADTFIDIERATAIRDLIEENVFVPVGRTGVFQLRLSLAEKRLVLDILDAAGAPLVRHMLSLTPLQRLVKDYFLICESYYAAVRTAAPGRIEAVDMGRRGLHNDGADILKARLAGKVEVDFDTARRLFTLVCALRWKG